LKVLAKHMPEQPGPLEVYDVFLRALAKALG
jgi:hypothetical protein